MLLLAVVAPEHRRAALTTAAIAFLFAVCEYRFETRD
jgi:hypothetical protein